jgi:hypothetical protein
VKTVIAKLKKHVTADGLTKVRDELAFGRTYVADLDSICTLEWGEVGTEIRVMRESIYVFNAEDVPPGGWMPTELLELGQRGGGDVRDEDV